MSILYDGVFSSISYHGRGMFKFNSICDEHKKLLKSIKQRQRKKFKNHGIVPRQLLKVLWDLDFLPNEKWPEEGMRIPGLLKFLREGKYRDKGNHARGILLHDKIDQEEYPSKIITHETLIQWGQSKKIFVLVSNEREKQGTIFK
jgi:hypothetical protein